MDDIDNLYKNLTHIANAYSATQTIILAWGAIFALVIGQLFIAYINLSDTQKKTNLGELIILMGFILSICWFAMSVISQRFQRDRIRKMTKLEVLIIVNCISFYNQNYLI